MVYRPSVATHGLTPGRPSCLAVSPVDQAPHVTLGTRRGVPVRVKEGCQFLKSMSAIAPTVGRVGAERSFPHGQHLAKILHDGRRRLAPHDREADAEPRSRPGRLGTSESKANTSDHAQ
jgi:hypothetical protein